jgi:hypothetical protein
MLEPRKVLLQHVVAVFEFRRCTTSEFKRDDFAITTGDISFGNLT